MKPSTFRLAAVQIDTHPGRVQENLEHATGMVEAAARQGAQLVLLPELMPGGYLLTEAVWDCAEPWDGPICSWLRKLARRLGIYLGTSFLEVEGEDFYNTFALASPDGELAGKVRKSPPASLEAYFYRAGCTSHVIETEIGRIGVGICYENLLFERLRDLLQAQVDLVLQPAAAGRPKPFRAGDVELFDRMVSRLAPRFARVLGVPVVMADRAGLIDTPLPGGYGEFKSSFPGLSCIVDGDASIKAAMNDAEGVIVAGVALSASRKRIDRPRAYQKMWALRVPWFAGIWPESQREGEAAYFRSEERRQQALAQSSLRTT